MITNIIIVLLSLLGVYVGWQRGFIKMISNFFALLISMVLASILKGWVSGFLYKFLPFFEYGGLKSINIIVYQIVVYFILILFFLAIYETILKQTKLDKKIADTEVSTSNLFSVLGAIAGIPLILLFLYNVLLVFNIPTIKINDFDDSVVANKLLNKTFIISSCNRGIYNSEEYVNKVDSNILLSKLDDTYKDNIILNYMVKQNLISKKNVTNLKEEGLLNSYIIKTEVNSDKTN